MPSTPRRVGFGLAIAFGLYLLIGYLVVPAVVESQLVSILAERTGQTPVVGKISFDPFRIRLTVEGFALPDPRGGEPAVAFEKLAIDAHLLGFLSADVALEEFLLVAPRISAVVDESGKLNFALLLESMAGESTATEETEATQDAQETGEADPAGGLPVVEVAVFRIERGDLRFLDRSQTPTFEVHVEPIALSIEGLTTRPEASSAYSMILQVGEEMELRWSGTLGLDPIRSEGDFALEGLDLRVPWDYVSDQLGFEVAKGTLDASARYALDPSKGLSLSDARLDLREVEILDAADRASVFTLTSLSVAGIEALANEDGLRTLDVEEIALEGGHLATYLEADGRLHLLDLLEPVDAPAESDSSASETGSSTGESPGPEIAIERVALSGFEIDLEDRGPARPVAIHASELALDIKGFRSTPGAPLEVSLRAGLGEAGRIAIQGPLTLEPLSTQLRIEAQSIELGEFQPYLEGLARLDVPKGSISSTLEVDVRDEGGDGPRVAVRGRVQIDDLLTVDRRLSKKFVGWERLALEGLDLDSKRLRIEQIALTGASARLVLDQQGLSNVDAIFGSGEAAVEENASAAAGQGGNEAGPLVIEIAEIKLERVRADVDDRAIDPPFAIFLNDLSGKIEGLSSQQLARAKVSLTGRVDDVAPVRIEGQFNPLSDDPYVDLTIVVNGVSMPPFSPYTGRFVGYRVGRGKLGLDLRYQLNASHLEASNRVLLEQFDLGDRVESKDATSLPVALALILMKDSAGDIAISLPIEGDIDDPSFDFFGVLGKTFVNLVTRVATAPFGVVAGLVGRSPEDLSNVVFEAGSVEMAEGEQAGLTDVVSLLAQRPKLRLEIRGKADPEIDGPGLRRARIEDALRLAVFESLSRRERKRVGDPEAVVLDSEQRLEQLERLYRERIGGRVRDLLTEEAMATSDEERTRALTEAALGALAAQVEVGDEDLRALARDRAAQVQAALLEGDRIEPDRVFVIDVEVGPSGLDGQVATELSLAAK